MVCTSKDLVEWKDFPKGLRVLVLDEDSNSAAEIRSKLEEMDYVVSTFYNENEALSAISNKSEGFHVAIVEVSTGNSDGRFKFLETVKDLPTIMTSDIHCLSSIMKCIALGAVEFLRKPLSEDKLRNIWQHVVHKAFNAGGKDLSELLKPVKESMVSMLQIQLENVEPKDRISVETEDLSQVQENNQDLSAGSDKYPAPSTPQIKQGVRLLDDGDCHDQTNFSTEKESAEQDGNSVAEATAQVSPQRLREGVKEEDESADGSKGEGESKLFSHPPNKDCPGDFDCNARNHKKAPGLHNSCGNKANRKRMKVDWTPELHKKFVQAVEKLGVDQAIPSRILELMKVEGLTRHNVASHLQKYRMHRRHILPKEGERIWPRPRDSLPTSSYSHRPILAFPPYHSNHSLPSGHIYPAWGPNSYQASIQMWGPPYYPAWQSTENWHWKPYPEMPADAWGCPIMPPHLGPRPFFPQGTDTMPNSWSVPHNSFDFHPAEEVIDKVVKEAISKPWLPLPLGLKPPSTDSVLTELSKQGISAIPPFIKGPRPR